jgi:hypothetical protein
MKKYLHILAVALIAGSLNALAAPVLETKSTAVGGSSTVTVAKPVGTQAGDLLIAALMLDRGSQIVVTTAPAGWKLIRRTDNSRYVGMATYYKMAGNTEPASYSFALDETAYWSAGISRISGADPAVPVQASSSKTGSSGNVTAASVTTKTSNTLVLAFFSNRRNATYTPDASTVEQYDAPNMTNGLPSNMLSMFGKTAAGSTGNKIAIPSRSDRQWAAQQVVIAGAAFTDQSGFTVSTSGIPVAGNAIGINVTEARNATGVLLNGPVAVTLTSSLDGQVFNNVAVFTEGKATATITLTSVASHTLNAGISGIANTKSLTVTVNRRPVTVTANAGLNKVKDEPDPLFTWTLTAGSLIEGIPLSGSLTRAPGENPGLYPIQQGSLKNDSNPTYTITFQPADFQITAPEEIPLSERGIWTSAEELAALPMSGATWLKLKEDADLYWGIPNLSDQEDKADIYTLAKALVYARTGIESYRTQVIEACMQAVGTEAGGRTLALGRNLGAFVIAADLVKLPPEKDAVFRTWLRDVLTEPMTEGNYLIWTHEVRPNDWGTCAGGSRAAVAAYLQDWEQLDRIAKVLKGWLGDRSSYAGFSYGDLSWQADPSRPVGINPKGTAIQGYSVDGALPDEQRRSGGFVWPPPKVSSVYDSLQGILMQAVILQRAGYDVWNWEDKALLRAFKWLYDAANYPAEGDDTWQIFVINHSYGAAVFPAPEVSDPGKNMTRTCWTHSGVYTSAPPPKTNAPPVNTNFEYYPGDYSAEGVLGNSLPGTWRPFSADSPWNTPIAGDAATHPDSGQIMSFITGRRSNIRFGNEYLVPVWVVNSGNARPVGTPTNPDRPMDLHWVHMNSPNIFDTWDQDNNGVSDIPFPLAKGTYPEPTADGHICIIDPFKKVAYEMSRHPGWTNNTPTCTTLNVWDLTGDGTGNPFEGKKWWARGGRGSGFPIIAGLLRPEEVLSGEIRHALTFTFGSNRKSDDGTDQIMIRPVACRSDGQDIGPQYPIEGMLFQLDPSLTEADFDRWGLTREGKVLARALQKYGMYLGDIGGDLALQVQLLGSTAAESRAAWDRLIPGFYSNVNKIPSNLFRVVYTGEPTLR